MREIVDGIRHWSAEHPGIHTRVSSYWLPQEGVALNPIAPPDEVRGAQLQAVVLTNRHHLRDSEQLGVAIRVPAEGMHDHAGTPRAAGYEDGDELPGGLLARQIGAISPDEYAVYIPARRAVALADGVMRDGDGPLTFVPDGLMGDDAERVKDDLRAAFAAMLDAWEVDHLLLAHGEPWVGDGGEALRAFLSGA